jgi:exopolyphosphatase/guanosine-5'-triphosphate,3'-diphosphate pyrophosphatase
VTEGGTRILERGGKVAISRATHAAYLTYDSLAAVDLGSNSFHLQIGRVVDDQVYPLDSLREPVRLGAGLTRDKKLDRATQVRALDALSRIGERLRGFPAGAVRAVGTNALRVAKNAGPFLADAQAALGFPIEVIYGREEARLIYLGVSHSLPLSPERRLVVDIGGGSTEFIIGTGYDPELMESLPMGCVSWTLRYFPDGRIERGAMRRAELAASTEIERIVRAYRKAGWQQAVGSSGTAKTIAATLAATGWSTGRITREGLAADAPPQGGRGRETRTAHGQGGTRGGARRRRGRARGGVRRPRPRTHGCLRGRASHGRALRPAGPRTAP